VPGTTKFDELDREIEGLLRELKRSGRLELVFKLLEAYYEYLREHAKLIADLRLVLEKQGKVLEELVERMEKLENRVASLENKVVSLEKRVESVEKSVKSLEKRVGNLEIAVGASTESFYCTMLWSDLASELASRGEVVVEKKRNARVDDRDVDLLVVTDKRVYVVEVEIKPVHKDVDELVEKARIAEKLYPGKEVVPILAGAWIGVEVEEYGKRKGVIVRSY